MTRQGSALLDLETLIADWDSDGEETDSELAVSIVEILREKHGFRFNNECDHALG